MRSRPLIAATFTLALAASAGFPAQFAHFTVRRLPDGVGVYADGTLLCRTRHGAASSFDPRAVASRLTMLAVAGLRPAEVRSEAIRGGARLVARGQTILTVDGPTAAAARNTPVALASAWGKGLRAFLQTPYVALDPDDRLVIPVGERRTVRYGGPAAGEVTFACLAPDLATVQVDAAKRLVTVAALARGSTVLAASLPGQPPHAVTLDLKQWAARIGNSASARITAPPLPHDDLRRVLRNAALAAVQPAPGARVQLGEPVQLGGAYALCIRAEGPELMPTEGTVTVRLLKTASPTAPTRELLVSNQPERITAPATLLRERLSGTGPVRLLWHHVNNLPDAVRYVVRVANRSPQAANLHVIDSITGPGDDEIFVGHTAMVRFLKLWEQGEGYVLTIPGGRMADLYDVRLPSELITSGLARIAPLEARDLVIEVAAENSWPTDAYFLPVPERLTDDPPMTPYRFEAEKTVALTYEVGGPWTFYHIGKDYSQNLQGQKLLGDYGVYYRIAATLRNPSPEPARCEVALRASGGVARATILVDGAMIETGLLQGAREQVIHQFVLGPGQERQLQLRTVPESGSNYPITMVLRSWR